LKLVALGDFGLVVGVSGGNFVLIDDDAIVVDLAEAVRLLQVVPADFVVERNVIAFAQP